jgi:hypothetical protein
VVVEVGCGEVKKPGVSQEKVTQISQKKRTYDNMTVNESIRSILTTISTITTLPRDMYKEGMEFVDTFKKERAENEP